MILKIPSEARDHYTYDELQVIHLRELNESFPFRAGR